MESAPYAMMERVALDGASQALRPELFGRITERIVFRPLALEVQRRIIETLIAWTHCRPVEEIIRVDLSWDVREYAKRIKIPALLITAIHDQIVPQAYSENLIPGAKTIELNSGHLIFLEKPVELASAILSFCQWQAGSVS